MLKFRRFLLCVLVPALILIIAPASAWGRNPEEALSVRPEKSVWLSIRLEDLGGVLRTVFSPENVEMFITPGMALSDASNLRLVAGIASQIPARSVAVLMGMDKDEKPFLQAAIALPPEMRSKLDLIAAGKAKAEDMVTLVLGDAGLLLAGAVKPALRKGKSGPYYLIDNEIALSAKEDLLLLALSPGDLQSSLDALSNAKNRFAPKRKFNDPDYYFLHADMATIMAAADMNNPKEADAANFLKSFFKAPLEVETAFRSEPGNFRISTAVNIEAFSGEERLKKEKPIPGGGMFLAGRGTVLLGMAGKPFFSAANLKLWPELEKAWKQIVAGASRIGVTEKEIENLLSGNLSLVVGGEASVEGYPVPGAYVTLTGQEGAAASILKKIFENPELTNAIPFAPLKVEGWETLVRVDPALVPAPLLLGNRDDTLFFGMLNSEDLNVKPEVAPAAAPLLEKEFFSVGFIDVAQIWSRIRAEFYDADSLMGQALSTLQPAWKEAIQNVLEADLPVSFITMQAAELGMGFLDISLVEVAPEKRLLPRIIASAQKLDLSDDGQESPLTLLLTVRDAIEAESPDTSIEELKEEFSDFVFFFEVNGSLYIGVQVAGDADKLELIENAEKFGFTGSAGLDLAPSGEPYDGQEVVWLKVER